MAGNSTKAVVAACIANGGIAIAKLVGFFFTGASSMLAEFVHSVADTGNQILLLLGNKRGKKAESEQHPFGYGRERYFWAFVVALVIFTLGSAYAIYEGTHKLSHPSEIESPLIAVAILVVAVLLEGWSFWTAVKEARLIKGNCSWWQFVRNTKTAELPVVLLEDLGAMMGLVIALAAIGLTTLTGDPRFDAIGSIVIGVLLGIIAVVLAVEMQSLLVGESASPETVRKIRERLLAADGICGVIHMRTVHLGPDELLIGAKVELDETLDTPGVCKAIDAAEELVRSEVQEARVIYLEPDVRRESPAQGS